MLRFVIVEVNRTGHAWNVDIVMGIAIIWDQSTACIIACKLNDIRVDLADRCKDRFAVWCLNNSLGLRNCCCGNLCVNAWINWYVASNNIKIDSVGASRVQIELLM